MSRLYYFFLIIFVIPFKLFSLDVKVLLMKRNLVSESDSSLNISAPHGFIISTSPDIIHGNKADDLRLAFYEDTIFLNGGKLNKNLYISLALPEERLNLLNLFVHKWFEENDKKILNFLKELSHFFDRFIAKSNKYDPFFYDPLIITSDKILDFFLEDLREFSDLAEFDKNKFFKLSYSFVKDKLKMDFLDLIASKQLEKKDRDLLNQSRSYRYQFFRKSLLSILQKEFFDFVKILPRNLLAKLLNLDEEPFSFGQNQYVGSLALIIENNNFYLINIIDSEDYLFSVVRNEAWPGWPMEVNKIIAIACRTYLVWQTLQARKSNRPYHIESTIKHQRYKGHHKKSFLRQAVEETRNICVGYEGKPILAMFDSCCGGVKTSLIDNSDFKKYPYLQRDDCCNFCKSCKVSSWSKKFSDNDIVKIFQKEIPSLISIDDIKVSGRDDAGLVKEVSVFTNGAILKLSGKKLYSLFPEIKSFCFDIEKVPNFEENLKKIKKKKKKSKLKQAEVIQEKYFIIQGVGYGHHVGLCQWGAMKLVKEHHLDYKQVLSFYYPNTSLILVNS